MTKSIAIVGTLDTKGDQVAYLKEQIENKKNKTVIIDIGILGTPACEADISREVVAEAGDTTLAALQELGPGKEAEAMGMMTTGARKIIYDLHSKGEFDAIIAIGGSMGTSLAMKAIEPLPLETPKIVLSTLANSPAIAADYFCNDIVMLPWVGGLWGINAIAKRRLDCAAGLIMGAAEVFNPIQSTGRTTIGITSLGMSAARYLYHMRPALKERNYEVAVFHATGMSSRLFEKAITNNNFDFVLDLYAGQELINHICGSLFSPGISRMEAAAKTGVPQIVSLGSPELCLWGSAKPLPPEYADRRIFPHNDLLHVLFTNLEEKVEMAKLMVEKLNRTTGPTALIVPLKAPFAISKWNFEDTEGLNAIREIFKAELKSQINYVEVDVSTDDEAFSVEVLRLMDDMIIK